MACHEWVELGYSCGCEGSYDGGGAYEARGARGNAGEVVEDNDGGAGGTHLGCKVLRLILKDSYRRLDEHSCDGIALVRR